MKFLRSMFVVLSVLGLMASMPHAVAQEEAPESRGLFYSIEENPYELTVVSYENQILTLSDSSVWEITPTFSLDLTEGQAVTMHFRTKLLGFFWMNAGVLYHKAKFVGVTAPDYRVIEAIDGRIIKLNDGSNWSIVAGSVASRWNARDWKVGDKVFVSKNDGDLYDDYLLVNLEKIESDAYTSSASAFLEKSAE